MLRVVKFLLPVLVAGCSAPVCPGSGSDCEPSSFELLRLSQSGGLCPLGSSCRRDIELAGDGWLRTLDTEGNPVTEVAIDPADLEAARTILLAPELRDLLTRPDSCAGAVADFSETTELVISGTTFENDTTGCDLGPIDEVRGLMSDLQDRYL